MGCFVSCYTQGEQVSFREIENTLKTGDLLLFSGKSFFSCQVKTITNSPWSHVAMVVRYAGEGERGRPRLYLWHSYSESTLGIRDVLTGKIKDGPQLNRLEEFLATYDGCAAVRFLLPPRGVSEASLERNCSKELDTWMREEAPKHYESNRLELVKSTCTGCFRVLCHNHSNQKEYFCSELCAQTYYNMDLLRLTRPANMYTPHDFSSSELLKLKRGFSLSPERLVVP